MLVSETYFSKTFEKVSDVSTNEYGEYISQMLLLKKEKKDRPFSKSLFD